MSGDSCSTQSASPSPIELATQDLSQEIDVLDTHVARLAVKLSPVLGSMPDQEKSLGSECSPSPSGSSDLVANIRGATARINARVRELADLTKRLEI